MRINDLAPNFSAKSTQGDISFHEWSRGSWTILFSHPKDFTPVCTTEVGAFARYEPEFSKRNCKLLGLSVDSVESHLSWLKDVQETQGSQVNFPILADENLEVSKLYGMLPNEELAGNRPPQQNATVRSVFVIDPELSIKMFLCYPMTTGRNLDELIRVLDSIQLTANFKVATPVNWNKGEKVIIASSVSDDNAKKLFKNGWVAEKPYLRIVDEPKS